MLRFEPINSTKPSLRRSKPAARKLRRDLSRAKDHREEIEMLLSLACADAENRRIG